MPAKFLWRGTKYKLYAWVNAGVCEFEVFLSELKARQRSDWKKIFPLIAKAAEGGPPDNDEQCRLVSDEQANELYEFVAGGGIRVFWFYDEDRIVFCCCISGGQDDRSLAICVDRALAIQHKYREEKRNGSLKEV